MPFEEYLIAKGYSRTTPKGKPSTAYNYASRVNAILTSEHAGVRATDITYIRGLVRLYDTGGAKADVGSRSNRANINALKQYLQYLLDCRY